VIGGLFRPTLVRRVVAALLFAFGLVYAVQLSLIFWQASAPDEALTQIALRGDSLLASIASQAGAEADRACPILLATVDMLNHERGTGRTVYGALTGPVHCATAGWPTAARTHGVLQIDGTTFVAYTGTRGAWTLSMLSAQRSGGWLLDRINRQMLPYLMLSFLLILVPIWLAVARGLRPLRTLSERIAARHPEDMSSIEAPANYAELTPLTDALNDLLARLRHRIAREQAFVQDAAHELRTPLAAISVHAHTVAVTGDAEARAGAARQLDTVIQRSAHLIDQLLALARLGHANENGAGFNPSGLLRDEALLIAPLAIERDIELTVDADADVLLSGDHSAATAIVANLLSNAVRYTPAGGRVIASVSATPGGIELSITDTGPGIPVSQRALIFDRFYRAAPDVPGTGLGLAIVRAAADRLGARIAVADAPTPPGTTFTVSFPPQGSGPGKNAAATKSSS
jgi:signal transduction histidine kinase